MTAKVIDLSSRRPAPHPDFADKTHIFSGTPIGASVDAHRASQAALVDVMRSLVAGKRDPSPLTAPSLHALRLLKRKGETLAEVMQHMLERKPGSWDYMLKPWGLVPTRFPDLNMSLDIGEGCKAEKTLAKALGPGWRAAVAADCYALDIKFGTLVPGVWHAYAQFRHRVPE